MESTHNSSVITSFTGWLGRMKTDDNIKHTAIQKIRDITNIGIKKLESVPRYETYFTHVMYESGDSHPTYWKYNPFEETAEQFYKRSGINIFKK